MGETWGIYVGDRPINRTNCHPFPDSCDRIGPRKKTISACSKGILFSADINISRKAETIKFSAERIGSSKSTIVGWSEVNGFTV
jgi:hypothetical protein